MLLEVLAEDFVCCCCLTVGVVSRPSWCQLATKNWFSSFKLFSSSLFSGYFWISETDASSSVSISLNNLSIDLFANSDTILDLSGVLSASPWSMPAVFVGGSTAEIVRTGLLLAHLLYLITSSIAFAFASALSPLSHPLRLLSESVFRLVSSCPRPKNHSSILALLMLVGLLQIFGFVVPAVRDWYCVSLGWAWRFAAATAAAAIDARRLCCCLRHCSFTPLWRR